MKYLFLVLFLMCAIVADSQTVRTPTGKTIPVSITAGADVTIAPIAAGVKVFGWLQVKDTLYPVYQGSRGGLYINRIPTRPNVDGEYIPYKDYVTDQAEKIVKE